MVSCDARAHIGWMERPVAPDPLRRPGDPSGGSQAVLSDSADASLRQTTTGGGALPPGRAVSPASRGLDPQPLAGPECPRGLRSHLVAPDEVAPERAVPAALCPRRRVTAALGQQRVRHVLERLDLADDPVAAAVLAVAAGVAAHRIPRH